MTTTESNDTVVAQLCPACGLCCNGVIFANLALRPGDDAARLRSLGVPVSDWRSTLRPPHLAQPCAAFDGSYCRVYADRPQYCRQFECALLQSVKAGRTQPPEALRVIRTARDRADKVHCLLGALGDTESQLPLSTRFRRTARRLQNRELEGAAADTYALLTLAVHDLNLLLADAFYPGKAAQRPKPCARTPAGALVCAALVFCASVAPLQADQVELQNGDRYVGHVLSLNTNTVVLQSEVLGTLRLARSKVAGITLGPVAGTNSLALPLTATARKRTSSTAPPNLTSNRAPALHGLSSSTNLIQQVQRQLLGDAGPEANDKFNELLGGLMGGTLSVDDIRAQAKAAADQLRALQRETGDDAGFAASAYLSILDHFLEETSPSSATTNAPPRPGGSTPAPAGRQH